MLYCFAQNKLKINCEISTYSDEELIFACAWFLVSDISSVNIKCQTNSFDKYSACLNSIGVKGEYSETGLTLSKKQIVNDDILQIDFKNAIELALPSAIVLAAWGVQADLKGLEQIKEMLPVFQRELYGFNINTDFCDYSKLKIYNDKKIVLKRKPVNTRNNYLSLCFIPLAAVFGNVEIEVNEDFFEKYKWLHPLLSVLQITAQKINS
ncbi:MAG: hypothetical protein ACHQNT_02735 [Bacteroidia bacterium]